MELHMKLDIACNKLSSIKQMYLDLFSEKAPCGSILVSDHSVFAFWVVAYVRFDCTTKIFLLLIQPGRSYCMQTENT